MSCRVESGVIDRSIYRWAVLAPGGVTADGWNHRLIYTFGGGCSAGYQQGSASLGSVLDDRMLSRGYSVLGSSLNVLNTACNDVLSAEAASMVKEHVIESLGEPPAWTMGWGGSGGSIQQQMIAQNYPGILDGLVPAASFPDNSAPDYPDCRLLVNYFGTAQGAALSAAQRSAITGLSDANGCSALGAGADVVRASEGCIEERRRRRQHLRPGKQPRRRPVHDLGQPGQRLRRGPGHRLRPPHPRQRRGPVRPEGTSGGLDHGRPVPRPQPGDRRLRRQRRPPGPALGRGPERSGDRLSHRADQPGDRRLPGGARNRHPQLQRQRGQRPPVPQHLQDARPPRPLRRRSRQPGDVPGDGRDQRQPDAGRGDRHHGDLARQHRGRWFGPPPGPEGRRRQARQRGRRLLDHRQPHRRARDPERHRPLLDHLPAAQPARRPRAAGRSTRSSPSAG